jgi:hypothetical protein
VTDEARLLSQTDNVALLRAGPLEIVRVGRANLTEEAWWRYGRELTGRRSKYRKLTAAGTVAAGAAMVGGWASGGIGLIGMWFLWEHAPGKVVDAARWLRFGGAAWRGDATCPDCGHRFQTVKYKDRGQIHLFTGRESGRGTGQDPVVALRCPRCRSVREGGLQLQGEEARTTLRRVLAYHHFSGASERRVRSATRLIEEAGSPDDLTRIVLRDGRRLADLQRTGAIALEIAANESSEQRLLELELAELESHWRREEELAAIVDGELTPLPLLEKLRRKVRDVASPG